MGPYPTYHPPEGEECETSVEHGLPLWAEPAVGCCSRRPSPSPTWGSRFVRAREVGPWVGAVAPSPTERTVMWGWPLLQPTAQGRGGRPHPSFPLSKGLHPQRSLDAVPCACGAYPTHPFALAPLPAPL